MEWRNKTGERTTLGANNAARAQRIEEELEERLPKQRLCRTLWVGGVGDDDVEFVFAVLQELEPVPDHDLDVRVLEADCHPGQVFLGQADHGLVETKKKKKTNCQGTPRLYVCVHGQDSGVCFRYLVNIAQDRLLDHLVLNHLAENTAVAAADHKHLLRVRVRIHRKVRDHFLVSSPPSVSRRVAF